MIDHETILVTILHARGLAEARRRHEIDHPTPRVYTIGQAIGEILSPQYGPVIEAKRRFAQYVANLPLTTARQLLAVMYVGRGDLDPWDIANADERFAHFEQSGWVANQMIGKTQLAEYLDQGLARATAAGLCQKGVLCHD